MMHVHTTGNNNVTTKIAAEFLVGECTFKEYERMTLKSSGVNTMNSTGDDTFKEYEQMTLESSGLSTMNSTGDDTFTEYEQMTLKSSGVSTMNSTGDEKRRCRCSR